MSWGRWTLGASFIAFVAAPGAPAQVGHTPAESPYVDLVYRQEVTTFSGYLSTRRDPAGVAPRSAPLIGVRYALHMAGPAILTARVAYARSERTVLDPYEPTATRVVFQSASVPLALGDVGISMSLTGFKSWNRLVPEVNAGLGFVSDFRTEGDVGGFSFGTRFALALGAGVRYVPGGRFQLRLDVTDYIYRLAYPNTYYRVASDQTTVVDPRQNQRFYTHNPSITLGVSYAFWR